MAKKLTEYEKQKQHHSDMTWANGIIASAQKRGWYGVITLKMENGMMKIHEYLIIGLSTMLVFNIYHHYHDVWYIHIGSYLLIYFVMDLWRIWHNKADSREIKRSINKIDDVLADIKKTKSKFQERVNKVYHEKETNQN